MIDLPNETSTLALGKKLAYIVPEQCLIFLQGDLGAGKTTLVRGFLRGLGYQGTVKSPTYALVESYQLDQKQIFHFDLYRLNAPEELEDIGIRDYFTQHAICLIEWPERAKTLLPAADLICNINNNNTSRKLVLKSLSVCGDSIINKLENEI